jgi:predicted transcriptional regulator
MGRMDDMKDNRIDNIVECAYNIDNGYVEVWFTD